MYKSDDGLPKYVVNWEELTQPLKEELLKIITDALKSKYPQVNAHNLEAILESIEDLLPSNYYQDLQRKIDDFVYKKVEGIQKVYGAYLDIPPIIKETQHDFKFDKDIFITGFHVDQTGWKKEDRYNLIINKQHLIKNAATKEIGEHKYFNTYFKVNANTPISLILENNSGNSREIAVDLEYIEGTTITLNPPPPPPTQDEYWIDQIPNNWDLAVVMNWEQCGTDVDLHGFIDSNHVYFSHPSGGGMYLNWDYTSHVTTQYPEIISINGNHGKQLKVFIHNYDGGPLSQPVSIKIYDKDVNGHSRLIKSYDYNLDTNRHKLYGICTVDIDSHTVTDLHEIKTVF